MVLGKAKVLSYEDLEEVRARRIAKEKATSSEKKRGRKPRSSAPEPGSIRISNQTGAGRPSARVNEGSNSDIMSPYSTNALA